MRMSVSEWICYLNSRITKLENGVPSSSSFLYGEKTPPQSLGKDGDLYMRLNGGFLYKKNNGFWEKEGKIQTDIIDGGEIL